MAWATPELLPWNTKEIPSPMTFLSWIRASCGLTLLSKRHDLDLPPEHAAGPIDVVGGEAGTA